MPPKKVPINLKRILNTLEEENEDERPSFNNKAESVFKLTNANRKLASIEETNEQNTEPETWPTEISEENLNTLSFYLPSNAEKFLCTTQTFARVLREDAKLTRVTPTRASIGEGAFGGVVSASLSFKGERGRPFSCVGAIKQLDRYGGGRWSPLLELAAYSRIQDTEYCAKALFAKMGGRSDMTQYVMQHLLMSGEAFTMGTLRATIKRLTTTQSVEEARSLRIRILELARCFIFQLLHGVAELHARNILHMDLKIDNTLIAHDGTVMLTDYGICNYAPAGHATPQAAYHRREVLAYFMPPDDRSAAINSTYDLWGVGVALCLLLTANPDAVSKYDQYQRAARDQINRLYGLNPDTHPLNQFLYACMRTKLSDRTTAEALLKHRWFDGLTTSKAKHILIEAINTYMAAQPSRRSHLSGISRLVARIQNQTRRTAATRNNTELEAYFPIRKAEPIKDFLPWKGWNRVDSDYILRVSLINRMLSILLDTNSNLPFYCMIHALELLERYMTVKGSTEGLTLSLADACIQIASEVSPFKQKVQYHSISHAPEVSTQKLEIIRTLQGDLFPISNGIVDTLIKVKFPIFFQYAFLFILVYTYNNTHLNKILDLCSKLAEQYYNHAEKQRNTNGKIKQIGFKPEEKEMLDRLIRRIIRYREHSPMIHYLLRVNPRKAEMLATLGLTEDQIYTPPVAAAPAVASGALAEENEENEEDGDVSPSVSVLNNAEYVTQIQYRTILPTEGWPAYPPAARRS